MVKDQIKDPEHSSIIAYTSTLRANDNTLILHLEIWRLNPRMFIVLGQSNNSTSENVFFPAWVHPTPADWRRETLELGRCQSTSQRRKHNRLQYLIFFSPEKASKPWNLPPFFIQFFLQDPEKHPAPPGLPEIWFQFGAALTLRAGGGGGGSEAADTYK